MKRAHASLACCHQQHGCFHTRAPLPMLCTGVVSREIPFKSPVSPWSCSYLREPEISGDIEGPAGSHCPAPGTPPRSPSPSPWEPWLLTHHDTDSDLAPLFSQLPVVGHSTAHGNTRVSLRHRAQEPVAWQTRSSTPIPTGSLSGVADWLVLPE